MPPIDYASFEKDLQALLDKYGVVLYPIPTYTQDKNGIWNTNAEIKVIPKPIQGIPEGSVKSDVIYDSTPATKEPLGN